MYEKHYFWGTLFIVIGLSLLLYNAGFHFLYFVKYIYLISSIFILLGLKMIFKKNWVKILLTILISITLSFTIMKFFGDTIWNHHNCCNNVLYHIDIN
ncbi:MAG: hypothetical protein A2X64_06090 [Ignavibacteria bacterium GWF2_33_9]|nr:MAG: hypothetical protein A2X64_06090 [Ignavibacteria bacterium GWF2_33_9]